jgi:hypothetical protein
MSLRFTQTILVRIIGRIFFTKISLFSLLYSDIEKDSSSGMEQTLEQIKKLIGEPRNYGPTPEEKAEMDRRAMEEKVTTPPYIVSGNLVFNIVCVINPAATDET